MSGLMGLVSTTGQTAITGTPGTGEAGRPGTARGGDTPDTSRHLPVETSERPPPAEQFDILAEALAVRQLAELERRGRLLRPDVF
jgi:hypothetical protein